ncbi:MAG: WYL domain-containing protein [Halanaerobiaceae bacterium]
MSRKKQDSNFLKGAIWYLYAYCQLREAYRIFRLSRMKNIIKKKNPILDITKAFQNLNRRTAGRKIAKR